MFCRNVWLLFSVLPLMVVLSCGEVADSSGSSGGGTILEAPTGLTADDITSATIKLTWVHDPSSEEGFTLQRSLSSDFSGVVEIPVAADSVSYLDKSLPTGHTYHYRLRAYNGALLSEWSNSAEQELTPVVVTPPAAPENISAAAQFSTSILISWDDKSDNETGFQLERANNAAFNSAVSFVVSANTESYTDNSCEPDTNYWYRIRSKNSAGSSAYIQTGPEKTPEPGPDTVVRVNFTDGIEHSDPYQKIYTIWLANPSEDFYRNIFICNKIKVQAQSGTGAGLTGTALPYWQHNLFHRFSDTEIDDVSSATIFNGDFTESITLEPSAPRQFTVYFEVDHSYDKNDWFVDQPAVLFAVDVDLDDPQTTYTMKYIGWTPNENTVDDVDGSVFGVLNTVLEYILKKKDPSGGFGDDEPYPATDLVGELTVTIEK